MIMLVLTVISFMAVCVSGKMFYDTYKATVRSGQTVGHVWWWAMLFIISFISFIYAGNAAF